MRNSTCFIGTLVMALALTACGDDDVALNDDTRPAARAASADDRDDLVEDALERDSTLGAYGLDADDRNGRIVLRGVVATEEQKALAAQVAEAQAAGIAVDNQIRVDANRGTPTRATDVDDIEERVEDALEADGSLGAFDLDVDEEDGQLVLEGRVDTAEQRSAAEEIARGIAGTVVVVNRITTP